MKGLIERRGIVLALLVLMAVDAQCGDFQRFSFSSGGNATDHSLYDAALGQGFEPGQPTRFSVRVPEGNYQVSLRFSRDRERGPITVRAEQRRLMLENVEVGSRKEQVVTFAVNVRRPALPPLPANAAGGSTVVLKPREYDSLNWDDKLTIELSPWPEALRYIDVAPANLPTLYLAGDSTVTDLAVAPSASWGQFITRYFNGDIAVANHAESGKTLKSFVTEMRFDKLLASLRAGDWVMIQFGHNDQKTQWPQTYADAATTYRSWLRTYIAEVRRRGATPMLVTPPERRNFDEQGRIRPSLADYPAAMRAVATQENVALIDLTALSVRFYEYLGPAIAPRAFADGGDDKTHHNEYGARQLARAVLEGLRVANPALTAGLEQHIAADAGTFDVSKPPLP